MKQRLLYPVEEAAELMALDRSQVYVLCSTGQLEWVDAKVKHDGRTRIRIPHEAIEKFMRTRTVKRTTSRAA